MLEVTTAFFPPMVTFLATPSPDPLIVTELPWSTEIGAIDVTVGTRLNALMLVAVPTDVVTVIDPLTPSVGTTAVIEVTVSDTIVAGDPPKATEVAPSRLTPSIVTVEPAAPDRADTDVITGAKT